MSNLVLVNKDSNKIYDIYDIKYDKSGYPHFLIYKDNQWIRMSAKHFRPAGADDYKRLIEEQRGVLNGMECCISQYQQR